MTWTAWPSVSEELKRMISQAQVPPELEAAIHAAYEELCLQEKHRPLVAMRSSAVGEDLTLTLPGNTPLISMSRPANW